MKKNSIDIEHSCLDPGVKHRDDGPTKYKIRITGPDKFVVRNLLIDLRILG